MDITYAKTYISIYAKNSTNRWEAEKGRKGGQASQLHIFINFYNRFYHEVILFLYFVNS